MMRVLRGLAGFIVLAFMLLTIAFAWGRLRGPNAEQAKALELFDQNMKPTTGRNAFPLIWLSDYDVPADQVDAIYALDRQHVEKWLDAFDIDGGSHSKLLEPSAASYKKLPSLTPEEMAISCSNRDEDCVAHVRTHPSELHALFVRQAVRIHHDEAIAKSDFDWNDLPPDNFAPLLPYGASYNLLLTSAALDFVDAGSNSARQQDALTKTCGIVQAMRRLHAHSNTLVGTMVAADRTVSAANAFDHMLAEIPAEQGLPDICLQAFAAVTVQDIDLRASMQREFQSFQNLFERFDGSREFDAHFSNKLTFSTTGLLRLQAAQFAWMCSAEVHAQMLNDRRFSGQDFPIQADVFDAISDFSGSVQTRIPAPAYADYLNRQEDLAATLRLVATVLWLRQTRGDAKPMAERLQHRPAWINFAGDRGLRLSADGRSLHMGHHGLNMMTPTEWPLPKDL